MRLTARQRAAAVANLAWLLANEPGTVLCFPNSGGVDLAELTRQGFTPGSDEPPPEPPLPWLSGPRAA
jgi:hypothetical protein